jgi:integrase/recombinase XerD
VRRFSAWLADEGETGRDELLGLKPPALDKANVPKLSDGELAALLKACQGKAFMDRRDEAVVRLAIETAARAEEILALEVSDIDLRRGLATVRRGKGGRGRRSPFGPQTAQALDRYLRLRRAHRLAGTPALWLGEPRQGLRLSRPAERPGAPRGRRRDRGIPHPPAAAHRGVPVARRGRQRRRADGRCRVAQPGHA